MTKGARRIGSAESTKLNEGNEAMCGAVLILCIPYADVECLLGIVSL
jgi:hypothetical protein